MSGELLFGLTVAGLLLAWVAASRPRQWLNIPSRRQAKPAGFVPQLLMGGPLLMWFLIACAAAYALTNPKRTVETAKIQLRDRVYVISIDCSTSMGNGPDSTMERIKEMTKEFVRKREGDFIGISAYSGASSKSRGNGYARVIVPPTDDLAQVESAIGVTKQGLLGAYTAIGDGIWVSIMALMEDQAADALGENYSRVRLERSVDSLGTPGEDLRYAQEVAEAVGTQTGKFIILFTDGKFNTGMFPPKAIWFARRLGMRVHFIAYESSGATGLSPQEQEENKRAIIKSVLESGGLYRESSNLDAMPALFEEVHRAEERTFILDRARRTVDRRYPVYVFMAACFIAWLLVEHLWLKVP
ncbi:MAG TPA: VWA domain-containing protein [Candidatus Paceibacterota bacterium]|nr:VWA domain-containing protein [Candidatus Paceibacterota bacterium]